jgi:hypothetical protein
MKLMVAIDAPQHEGVATHHFEPGLYVSDFCFLVGHTVSVGALDTGIPSVNGIIYLPDEGILVFADCDFLGTQ